MNPNIEDLPEFPFFTIITAVYNGEKTLQRTIDSVLSQSYKNFEYIIVDGGSTDNTLSIIKKNEHPSLTWISEPDNGVYDAFNKGIKLANGKLVGIINSDDWYEPEALLQIRNAYDIEKNAHIYYGLARFLNSNNEILAVQGYTELSLNYGMISHPTCFVKRETYDNVATFDTKYQIAADYNLMLTLKRAGCKFHFIEVILANFSEGGISTTNRLDSRKETLQIKFNHKLISYLRYKIGQLQLWIIRTLGFN
ncbi:glycosyltransferase family 2 protein [Dyadobacter sp. 32]|uniref:glycosyltransferase family 2 protein n=1 Tax=Dyadobacter sp. 32 TaxID=538966 RepID=UPI0011ED74B2